MVKRYKNEDYELGDPEFNLKLQEKTLILKASVKYNSDLWEMACALRITVNSLKSKIYLHRLEINTNDE